MKRRQFLKTALAVPVAASMPVLVPEPSPLLEDPAGPNVLPEPGDVYPVTPSGRGFDRVYYTTELEEDAGACNLVGYLRDRVGRTLAQAEDQAILNL